MKIIIILFVLVTTLFFVVGCGPGEPFEIEGMHTPQSETPANVVAAEQMS